MTWTCSDCFHEIHVNRSPYDPNLCSDLEGVEKQ